MQDKSLQILATIVVCLVLVLSNIPVKAQFNWQLVHTDYDQQNYFIFNTLTCFGNDCIAAGSIVDGATFEVSPTLWNSSDEGSTWLPVTAGISPTGLSNKHYFTDIQYVDSSYVVATGDFGVLLYSLDHGLTWKQKGFGNNFVIKNFHFSDSLNGILLAYEGAFLTSVGIYTTENGGELWSRSSFKTFNEIVVGDFAECHSYGNGKFRVFRSGHGPIYSTLDGWKTIDSTEAFFNDLEDPESYYLRSCTFSGGDTIIAYGKFRDSALLISSTDGGISWTNPQIYPYIESISRMTSLQRDTVFAAGESINKILISTDHGFSWMADSILLDTSYITVWPSGLEVTSSGIPVAIFADKAADNIPSIIIRGMKGPSIVKKIDYPELQISPNPADQFVFLRAQMTSKYHIIDAAGRIVNTLVFDGSTEKTFDCSRLDNGIYSIVEINKGISVPNKLIIIH